MKQIYQQEEIIHDEEYQWSLNRRRWFKLAFLGGIALSSPWIVSCDHHENNTAPNLDSKGLLTSEEMNLLFALQNVLVPNGGNGPSAADVNAHQYFIWMLSDPLYPQDDKDYFIGRLNEFNDLFKEQQQQSFHQSSETIQQEFITAQLATSWVESFVSRMITVIFEAMLLDPIYGGNTNEIGWEWLEHLPGFPQPNETTKYPEILKIINPSKV